MASGLIVNNLDHEITVFEEFSISGFIRISCFQIYNFNYIENIFNIFNIHNIYNSNINYNYNHHYNDNYNYDNRLSN